MVYPTRKQRVDRIKRRGVRLFSYDAQVEPPDEELCLTIRGTDEDFRNAAGLLYGEAASLPARQSQQDELSTPLVFNESRRQSFLRIAIELLGQSVQCEDDMFQLRQSPTNPYHLEQSLDGGDTWFLAYDYSQVCQPAPSDLMDYIREILDRYEENRGIVDVGDVYDLWGEYDDGGNDTQENAICFAIQLLVKLIAESHAEHIRSNQLNSPLGSIFAAAAGVSAAATTLGWLPMVFSPWLTLGMALAAFGARMAQGLISDELEVYEDQDAISEVSCCMYAVFSSNQHTMDFPTFQSLAASCGTDPDDNAFKLADAVHDALQDIDVFYQFIVLVNEIQIAGAGFFDLQCDCIDPLCAFDEPPASWNFADGSSSFSNWGGADNPSAGFPGVTIPNLYAGIQLEGATSHVVANEGWRATSGDEWQTTRIRKNMGGDRLVSRIVMRAGGSSLNQKNLGMLVLPKTSTGVADFWFVFGSQTYPIGSPAFVTLDRSREPLCCVAKIYLWCWSKHTEGRWITQAAINQGL